MYYLKPVCKNCGYDMLLIQTITDTGIADLLLITDSVYTGGKSIAERLNDCETEEQVLREIDQYGELNLCMWSKHSVILFALCTKCGNKIDLSDIELLDDIIPLSRDKNFRLKLIYIEEDPVYGSTPGSE